MSFVVRKQGLREKNTNGPLSKKEQQGGGRKQKIERRRCFSVVASKAFNDNDSFIFVILNAFEQY